MPLATKQTSVVPHDRLSLAPRTASVIQPHEPPMGQALVFQSRRTQTMTYIPCPTTHSTRTSRAPLALLAAYVPSAAKGAPLPWQPLDPIAQEWAMLDAAARGPCFVVWCRHKGKGE